MRTRMILALAAATMLAGACASTASTSAPTIAPAPATAVATPADTPVPAPAVTKPPAASPSPTPVPPTDGEGDEVVVGNLANPRVSKPWTEQTVGGVLQYRDGQVTMAQTTNDPRATGVVTFEINLDRYPKAASQYGAWSLTNEGGAWAGLCTGGAWADSDAIAWGCWLTGSGDYAGYTLFQTVNKEVGQAPVVRGVIYEGAPPKV